MESTCGGKYYVSRIGGVLKKKFADTFEKVCRQNENLNTEYTTPPNNDLCSVGKVDGDFLVIFLLFRSLDLI